jgi:hypothetical protein
VPQRRLRPTAAPSERRPPCTSHEKEIHSAQVVETRRQRRELDGGCGPGPVGVEQQRARRAVVDDAVAGIHRRRADDELVGVDSRAETGEDRGAQDDRVIVDIEVRDRIDVVCGIECAVEQETILAVEADERISSAAAIEDVVPVVAGDDIAAVVAGEIDAVETSPRAARGEAIASGEWA